MPAPAAYQGRLGQGFDGVVAALHVQVGSHQIEQGERRALVEQHDKIHALQRGKHRGAVVLRIERAVGPLAQGACRGVRIQAHDQARPLGARLREIGHMAPVQDVEHAVGEHQRTRE